MILVYSPQLTARLAYILDTFLRDIAGFDYCATDQWQEYLDFEGPKINYSKDYHEAGLFVAAADLLFRTGIDAKEPPCRKGGSGTVIFPNEDSRTCIDFDPFAAAFYLLSLYDEYLPHPEDQHQRIIPESSFVVRHGFVRQPVVEVWARAFTSIIFKRFGLSPQRPAVFRFQPSFDIDQAYSYRHKGFFRNLKGMARDGLQGNFSLLKERLLVLNGIRKDPFDNYDYLLDLHKKIGIDPVFFILFTNPGPYDKNLSIHKPQFRKLIRKLDCLGGCGIHPSYNTRLAPALMKSEIKALARALSGPVTMSRQHYLRFKVPQTFRHLIAAGIRDDYSLGYAGLPGFRAGMSSAFPFYDLEKEAPTKLMLHPMSYMEGTLRDYLDLGPEESITIIRDLMNSVKNARGTFVSLWHNESLSEQGRWVGWRKVYEAMLEMATKESI